MLTEKPWRLDAVMRLLLGLFICLSGGIFLGQLLFAGMSHLPLDDQKFYSSVVGTVFFQGASLVLIHFFLRSHGMRWREFFRGPSPGVSRTVILGLAAGLAVLPAALLLNSLSAKALSLLLGREPDIQPSIKVLQTSYTFGQRFFFGTAAIVVAPVVEESIFRGVLYPAVKQAGYPRLALWGSSLLFASIHLNLMTFIPLTFLSLVLVWLYERTDALLAPVLTHAFFNTVNFLMFIYQDKLSRFFDALK